MTARCCFVPMFSVRACVISCVTRFSPIALPQDVPIFRLKASIAPMFASLSQSTSSA
jgi:hypothetical protein